MDGNTLSLILLLLFLIVKIRPLMDGNFLRILGVESIIVKIRPLMDGNSEPPPPPRLSELKSDH